MSEHQIYDFRCLDRTLTKEERAELRSISTRAKITSTRFHNEYNWGDLKAEPLEMVAVYFDAFFYLANWGTRWLMLKFPASLVPLDDLQPYLDEDRIEAWKHDEHTILGVRSREEEGAEDYGECIDALDDLAPLRDQIMQGDYRALFMLWLDNTVYIDDPDMPEDVLSSISLPIPQGLGALGKPLERLIDVFYLDEHLIKAAAKLAPAPPSTPRQLDVKDVLAELSVSQKDALLERVAQNDTSVRTELRRAMRQPPPPSKGVEIRALAEMARALRDGERLAMRQRQEAALAKKQDEETKMRRMHLRQVARRWEVVWTKVYDHIDLGNRKAYGMAAGLIVDLFDAAPDQAHRIDAQERVDQLRTLYANRRALMDELAKRGIS